jgi:hypothetical protein
VTGALARKFITCKSIDEMSTILKTAVGEYRPSLAPSADKECTAAAKEAIKSHTPDRILPNVASYKGSAQRGREHFLKEANDRAKAIGISKNGYIPLDGGWSRDSLPFGLIMINDTDEAGSAYTKPDRNGKEVPAKKSSREPFGFTSVLDCGNCWLCGQKVYSYSNSDTNTACGECEHVGAITASFFAAMLLKPTTNLKNIIYGYGVSDVNCNQRKWDLISVRFNIKNDFLWNVDRKGAFDIATRIMNNSLHGQSYCPEYARWFGNASKNKQRSIDEMVERILKQSQLWCDVANAHLKSKAKVTGPTTVMSEKQAVAGITRILQESVDAISGLSGGSGKFAPMMLDEGPSAPMMLDYEGPSAPMVKIYPTEGRELKKSKTSPPSFVVEVIGADVARAPPITARAPPLFAPNDMASGQITPSDSQAQEYNQAEFDAQIKALFERLEHERLELERLIDEERYVNDDDSSQFFAALSEALKHVDYPDEFDLDEDANILLKRLQVDYNLEGSHVKRMIYNLDKVFNPAASASSSGKMDFSDDDFYGGSVKRRKTNKKYKYPKKRRNTKRKNHKNKKSRT